MIPTSSPKHVKREALTLFLLSVAITAVVVDALVPGVWTPGRDLDNVVPTGLWAPIRNLNDKHVCTFTYLAVSDTVETGNMFMQSPKIPKSLSCVFVGFIKRGKIGVCVSKPAAAAAREEVVVRRLSPRPQSPVPAAAAATKGHSGLLTNSKSGHSGLLSSKSGQLGGDSKRMKGLFKSKPRTPVDIVRQTRDILIFADQSSTSLSDSKREEKMAELAKNIRELKSILYGNSESEPVSEACAQLTQEFFRENTLRLLIVCLPQLNLEARKDATQIVANLQRQQVNSRLIASDYLEKNTDLLDILIAGVFKWFCHVNYTSWDPLTTVSCFFSYANTDMALHYGVMLRECIRHQTVARYVLESPNVKKLFDYIQLPYFDISADAAATFKELLTRHKSTVAEFLSKNYDWFFAEFNSKLLESTNYITRRQAVKLLGDILLDRSNAVVMTRYVSSRDNLRILMNLLRVVRTSISYIIGNFYVMNPPLQESSKSIQVEAFHVFKLFVANQNKPPDIISILVANRSKLLRLFADFKIDKEDEQFEADKAQVVREIASLEPRE
ncbi:hypothetical protein SADUNF_Sadunf16G0015600 [Salix dunnii]|uniref:MO25-like protein n=1 Tax=Salix dunnii TaxID=1413687 RepID=A0A835JBT4_9ROSI|nr:hypothetical protein SADUNF_Sadunf16G0015600 [Salix dunnii]